MTSISEERERRQISVFTKWVNSILKAKGVEVKDLSTCFQYINNSKDGVYLCYLYESIADEKLHGYSTKPRGQFQKTNNLAIVLRRINQFVQRCGIGLQYSASSIESGDTRQILGIIWILITKFVLPWEEDDSDESLSQKKFLLRWVQQVTEKYDNVDVKNFTRSWKDGLAFNALLDQFDNSLMNYGSLTKHNPSKNIENAFSIAEKLGIYRLLDVEDITDLDVPDEKSVMTYVSTMYQFFLSRPSSTTPAPTPTPSHHVPSPSAHVPPPTTTVPNNNEFQPTNEKVDRYAFLVGQNDGLNCCHNDVDRVGRKLEEYGYICDKHYDVTYSEFRKYFLKFCQSQIKKGREGGSCHVVIYYSGHGFQKEGANYLCCFRRDDESEDMKVNTLVKKLRGLKRSVKQVFFFFDCCQYDPSDETYKRKGSGGGGGSGQSIMINNLNPDDGQLVFGYACLPGLSAYEKNGSGVYTRTLLEHFDRRTEILDILRSSNKDLKETEKQSGYIATTAWDKLYL